MPDESRRLFLRGAALALGAIVVGVDAAPLLAHTAHGPDDEPSDAVKKVLRAHFGDRRIEVGHVQLDVPEVAPDSREVPLFIDTDLPMTADRFVKAIHVVVDFNPDIYLAGFGLSPAMGAATIDTRIKMRRSSHVRAIAEMNTGELWSAAKFVYTTLNGCV